MVCAKKRWPTKRLEIEPSQETEFFFVLDLSIFSRAWHWLNDFPRLALVACFPALIADSALHKLRCIDFFES